MSEPEEILAQADRLLSEGGRLSGANVVVTAGPTREPIDPT
jgi:phosphopantothenoylcysteine decarboxylase/phosphopantothenate--cysteine ligase